MATVSKGLTKSLISSDVADDYEQRLGIYEGGLGVPVDMYPTSVDFQRLTDRAIRREFTLSGGKKIDDAERSADHDVKHSVRHPDPAVMRETAKKLRSFSKPGKGVYAHGYYIRL